MQNFNISGLQSSAAELKPASLYAILAPLDNFATELALHAINKPSASDIYIVSSQIETFFEGPFSNALNHAFDQHKVHPFRFSADTRDWPKQQIINNTLKELNAYKQLNNALVIVHFSTTDLASLDQKQLIQSVQTYKKFSTQSGATVLFLVSGPEVTNYRFLLRRLNSDLDGLVYVENDSTVRVLEYDYWHHSTGIIASVQYPLMIENGCFKVQQNSITEQQTSTSGVFADEDDVWIVQGAIPEGTKLPAKYKIIKDNNALFAKGPKLEAATLVFAVSRYTDLGLLAKQCFELRKNCGRWLKLVIQNFDGVIRHQDECLFLTLGVNLILYSFSEPSRLLSQVQSIQGFQFSRPLPPSIEHVLQFTENTFSKGYLPFIEFTKQVEVHSDSAVNLGVSGVLVKLELLPRIDPIHPLHLFHIKREGDVFSLVENTVYLYLHACRENDVNNAIKHLFKLETNDFFAQQNIISDHFYIQQECKQLRRYYAGQDITDYSAQLKENESYKFSQKIDASVAADLETPEFTKNERADAVPFKMAIKSNV